MKKIDLLYLIVVMFYLISGLIKWNMTTIFACVLSLIFMVITNVIGKKLGFGNGIKILIMLSTLLNGKTTATLDSISDIIHNPLLSPIADLIQNIPPLLWSPI